VRLLNRVEFVPLVRSSSVPLSAVSTAVRDSVKDAVCLTRDGEEELMM